MKIPHCLPSTVVLAALAILASSASADVVETKAGAHLVGKIQKISDGAVTLSTDYAGDLVIKQAEITAMSTDTPVTVRLASGAVMTGTIATTNGAVKISSSDGELNTNVSKVAASWPVGQEDPKVAALRRHWTYEVALDATGKSGNSEQLGTAVSARAVLKTPEDTLQFYTAYNRQVVDQNKSADQFKGGVDYQNNFATKVGWYVRDEGGFDRIKDIQLYDVAGGGLAYNFIKEPKHTFIGRLGLSYRYEGYRNPVTQDVSSAGLDVGIEHVWTLGRGTISNRIAYVPAFEDFGNFRINHESTYEIPISDSYWKLRLGISNDYNSKPGPGIEKLDTTYFTRLVLTFGQP
ncbi:MAG TPA: DUF481 domain-containing protein [Opitutus sp.]|nr:DUF481 domain-containing protein [Opitutus sp.]